MDIVPLGFLLLSGFFLRAIGRIYLYPVYISLIVVLLCAPILFIIRDRFSWKSLFLVIYPVFTAMLLLMQSVRIEFRTDIVTEMARLVIPPLSVPIALFCLSVIKPKRNIYAIVIDFNIALLFVELAYRMYTSIGLSGFTLAGFYSYKYSSLLFQDSNFVGFNIVALLVFLDYAKDAIPRFKLKRAALLILLVLTFSRSCFITMFLIWVIQWIERAHLAMKTVILIAVVTAAAIAIPILMTDGSVVTKMDIFKYFNEWLNTATPGDLLFGIGSGNFIVKFNRESHTFFGLTTENGFLWAAGTALYLITLLRFTKGRGRYLLLSLLINGLSLFPVAYLNLFYILVSIQLRDADTLGDARPSLPLAQES
jgi:hypothetical protein